MSIYQHIQDKLQAFIRKYYTNELIKGLILFLSFGLLYFIFTLLVEYFLWLGPLPRTLLFWLFITVEIILFLRYIAYPLFKLIGFARGISPEQASAIIGNHFPEIDDKLLNMLQLHNSSNQSELVLASIEQKAKTLQPIPFTKAIRFTRNTRYLKYLLIPLLMILFIYLSGKLDSFNDSYVRIMHHQTPYTPPAPFHFQLQNSSLEVVEGHSLPLHIAIVGDVIPQEAMIFFEDELYFLHQESPGMFSYTFDTPSRDFTFYFEANGIRSRSYSVHIIPTPKIQHIQMHVHYPKYVHKADQILTNTGNLVVPVGTLISWHIATSQVDSLYFISDRHTQSFSAHSGSFSFSKKILTDISYTIAASNQYLSQYEKLHFSIAVLEDAYPQMEIKTDIDSTATATAQFIGQLSDDYGLSKLELIYYDQLHPAQHHVHVIPIPKARIANFYYVFPSQLDLQPGIDYEFYFKLYDNDEVHGSKSTKSKLYSFHKDTPIEREQKLLNAQKEQLKHLSKNITRQYENRKQVKELSQLLKNLSQPDYQTRSQLQNYLTKQQDNLDQMQQQTQELLQNLQQQPPLDNPFINDQKNAILNRLKETQALLKEQKLLDELQKLADKLDKEHLLDKLERLRANSKQKEKSLAQLLELTKRFYVEQKAQQISETLSKLAQEQQKLSESKDNSLEKQQKLTDAFDQIKKDLQQLDRDNQDLKKPMDFEVPPEEQESISKDQNDASSDLQSNKNKAAQSKQKSAASKMQQMSQSMQSQMQMAQGDMIQEDIALLRIILENLITFSYKQEDLMLQMSDESHTTAQFVTHLKAQNTLKTYFEHIDDSLYVLSLRQPKLSVYLNKYLSNAHYYLNASLSHYTDNQYNKANSDQHSVMKAANDIALLLSNLLDNMQSTMMGKGQGQGQGKGKGQNGQSFSLPDIIKQQSELAKESSQGQAGKPASGSDGKSGEKGSQQSDSSGTKSGNSGANADAETYRIYQQQARLRNALENQLHDIQSPAIKKQASSVITKMEQLERLILEQGITQQVTQRMLALHYNLLQLKNAKEQQEQETKRQSHTAPPSLPTKTPQQIQFFNTYYKQMEILNREALPFTTPYQQKIQHYFKIAP